MHTFVFNLLDEHLEAVLIVQLLHLPLHLYVLYPLVDYLSHPLYPLVPLGDHSHQPLLLLLVMLDQLLMLVLEPPLLLLLIPLPPLPLLVPLLRPVRHQLLQLLRKVPLEPLDLDCPLLQLHMPLLLLLFCLKQAHGLVVVAVTLAFGTLLRLSVQLGKKEERVH